MLRAHVERLEVVGLDEAYIDLTGSTATGRRAAGEGGGSRGNRPALLDRDRPDKPVAKVSSDAEKPDGFLEMCATRGVRALRGRLARPDSRGSARRRSSGWSRTGSTRSPRWPPPDAARHLVRRPARPAPRPARALRGRAPIELSRVAKSESRETTFDYDLHGLEADRAGARRLTASCARAGAQERAAAHRHQGAPRRLLDAHPRAHARGARRRRGRRGRSRWSCCAFDPTRPVRLLGVRVAGWTRAAGRPPAPTSSAVALRYLDDPDRAGRAEVQPVLVASVRSYSRPATYGPRSITGTVTERPW